MNVGNFVECTNEAQATGITKGLVYEILDVETCDHELTIFVMSDHRKKAEYFASRFRVMKMPEVAKRDVIAHVKAHPLWMVKGEGSTSWEHHCEGSANTEAKRLAAQHPGKVFTVLGPIRSYHKSELQCTEWNEELRSGGPSDVPF